MWIALVGDPLVGHRICGPFASEKAIDIGAVEEAYDAKFPFFTSGVWTIKLNKPSVHDACVVLDEPMAPDAGYAVNGVAVVFGGDITSDWHDQFYGPFKSIEAAWKWCAARGIGTDCVIPLRLVPVKKAA